MNITIRWQKKDFTDVIQLRILRLRDYSEEARNTSKVTKGAIAQPAP